MKFYLLAILVLTVQEVVSTNALLLEALHGHYALWIIHGIFVAATCGSAAASYWIGPSTSSCGARSRTSAVASRTFSTSAPLPEVPVE